MRSMNPNNYKLVFSSTNHKKNFLVEIILCAVADCYNYSNNKNTIEKISYFRLPSDESLRRTWLSKIRRQDLQQIIIAFVFVIYMLKKISFNTK